MKRQYERKFDWDEALRLREAGATIKSIAATLGVSETAVFRVVKPGERERFAEYRKNFDRTGQCSDCGGPMNRTAAYNGSTRCVRCSAIARGTTARDGELQCITCREWKPDDSFPHNRVEKHARRGRHHECRACNTASRRAHRERNREADNAYQREYRRRRRAAA